MRFGALKFIYEICLQLQLEATGDPPQITPKSDVWGWGFPRSTPFFIKITQPGRSTVDLQGVVSDAEHFGALAVSRERSIGSC